MDKSLRIPELEEQLKDDFAKIQHSLNGDSRVFYNRERKNYFDQFNELGFPSVKNEDWKYSNIGPFLRKAFNQQLSAKEIQIDKQLFSQLLEAEFDAHLLVFVNGFFSKELSVVGELEEGVIATNMQQAAKEHTEIFNKYYTSKLVVENNGFIALNNAFTRDGAFIYVPRNVEQKKPFHLLFITDAGEDNKLNHPHNLIITEENASATVVENFHVIGDNTGFSNAVTEAYIAESARLNYYKVQDQKENELHIGTTQITQQRSSLLYAVTIALGGAFTKNHLNVVLEGEGAESHFFGLYEGNGNEIVDNHTMIDHAVPNCFSNEYYKGILDGKSKGIFNGKIMVRKDAQKTNAFQSNKNILLSDTADINTKPQLEIFADDVKCSHGATIGQMNEEAMFYMQARGISEENARAMLLHAFASDILNKINIEPLQEALDEKVIKRIGKGLTELNA